MFGNLVMVGLVLALHAPMQKQSDYVGVSKATISLTLPGGTMADAIRAIFDAANRQHSELKLTLRFDPSSQPVANSLRRSGVLHRISVNDALFEVINGGMHTGMALSIRKVADVFAFSEPTVSVVGKNLQPRDALLQILRFSGCDFCADLSEFAGASVTMNLREVPISRAFQAVEEQVSPKVQHTLRFSNGCYIVSPTRSSTEYVEFANRPVIAGIYSHNRAEAVAAICECLGFGFVVEVDAPLSGTVTAGANIRTGGELVTKMLKGGPDDLTYIAGDATLTIVARAPLEEHGKE